MDGDFYSTLAQTGCWRFIPLEVSKGRLADAVPARDRQAQTKGNHAIMLYLSRHATAFELDAIVACVSEESTLIAHVRRYQGGIDIREALDADSWNRQVSER